MEKKQSSEGIVFAKACIYQVFQRLSSSEKSRRHSDYNTPLEAAVVGLTMKTAFT